MVTQTGCERPFWYYEDRGLIKMYKRQIGSETLVIYDTIGEDDKYVIQISCMDKLTKKPMICVNGDMNKIFDEAERLFAEVLTSNISKMQNNLKLISVGQLNHDGGY